VGLGLDEIRSRSCMIRSFLSKSLEKFSDVMTLCAVVDHVINLKLEKGNLKLGGKLLIPPVPPHHD
jgi:hypothetical protein